MSKRSGISESLNIPSRQCRRSSSSQAGMTASHPSNMPMADSGSFVGSRTNGSSHMDSAGASAFLSRTTVSIPALLARYTASMPCRAPPTIANLILLTLPPLGSVGIEERNVLGTGGMAVTHLLQHLVHARDGTVSVLYVQFV